MNTDKIVAQLRGSLLSLQLAWVQSDADPWAAAQSVARANLGRVLVLTSPTGHHEGLYEVVRRLALNILTVYDMIVCRGPAGADYLRGCIAELESLLRLLEGGWDGRWDEPPGSHRHCSQCGGRLPEDPSNLVEGCDQEEHF